VQHRPHQPTRAHAADRALILMSVNSSEEFHAWTESLEDPVTDADPAVTQVMEPWSDLSKCSAACLAYSRVRSSGQNRPDRIR
jgi:hypothetical protein